MSSCDLYMVVVPAIAMAGFLCQMFLRRGDK